MKWVALAVIGFVLGMAVGHLRQRVPHFELPAMPALASLRSVLPGVAPRLGNENPTLRSAIEPVYEVLFGPLNDGKAVAVAVDETAEIEKMMARVEANGASEAARRVIAMMKAAVSETARFSKSSAQPVAEALGGEAGAADFFGSVFEKRWRTNMGALATNAAPEWRQFVDVDALTPCPEKSQIAIATLLAQRRLRELERTAIRIGGTVVGVLDGGALVELPMNVETIFVSAFPGAEIAVQVSIMVHPAGTHQYSTPEGGKKAVRKYRFFRHTDKTDDEKAARQ